MSSLPPHLELETIKLIQEIYKQDILSYEDALELFTDENELIKLRRVMERMGLIMPHRENKEFELTFQGLTTAAATFIPDVREAAAGELDEEVLFEKMTQFKQL